MKIKASFYRHIDRHKKPSPGKVRARVGLVGSADGGLPSGESTLQLCHSGACSPHV